MIRTLSTLALLAALASPALAEDVRVSLAGKDDAAIRSDIHKAAAKVCTEAYIGDRGVFREWADCVDQASSDGLAQAKAIKQAAAAPPGSTDLAALAPQSAERR